MVDLLYLFYILILITPWHLLYIHGALSLSFYFFFHCLLYFPLFLVDFLSWQTLTGRIYRCRTKKCATEVAAPVFRCCPLLSRADTTSVNWIQWARISRCVTHSTGVPCFRRRAWNGEVMQWLPLSCSLSLPALMYCLREQKYCTIETITNNAKEKIMK